MEVINNINEYIINFIEAVGAWGPLLACLLIIIESIIPVLPLAVFITFNFIAFGKLLGFIFSWACTIIGCIMSFMIFRKGLHKYFNKHIKENGKVNKLMNKITYISFKNLVIIIALPFTPAFLVNIAAGLSDMTIKKYFYALLIGKISLVYFWGYIGSNIITMFTNPVNFLKVSLMLIIMYILSSIVNKKYDL